MPWILSPRIFISYARADAAFVEDLVRELRARGFRVFLDTADIDPGDNFVSRLTKEIRRATGVVVVVSADYARSRWGQAELYSALASGKAVIPIVLSGSGIDQLDEPLRRLLRDTQYVSVPERQFDETFKSRFADLLAVARKRYRKEIAARFIPVALGGMAVAGALWWAVSQLNEIEQGRKRSDVLAQISDAQAVLQHERIANLASLVVGDRIALGEIIYLSQDPTRSDVARFNALAVGSELRKGQKKWRWYVQALPLENVKLANVTFAQTSFLGGAWNKVRFDDVTFSGAFWPAKNGVVMSGAAFRNVGFFGSELEAITAIDVDFVNTKFRGSVVDTTNFSKVRFSTEEPSVEGNPVITPQFALFERSVIISGRQPPAKGVLDLTMTGDDVVFDGVLFVDCRLEGWFRPEWFRKSSFQNCVLPDSLTKRDLERTGNTVH